MNLLGIEIELTIPAIANPLDSIRQLVVGRELTKQFEEFKRGKAADLIAFWDDRPIKGEVVLLIEGAPEKPLQEWEQFSPEEHVQYLEETYHLSRVEAIKLAAKTRGISRRDLYSSIMKKDE